LEKIQIRQFSKILHFGICYKKNELNIPESCPILNTDINVDYVFVADEAFGISQHVLRPYRGRNLTKNKRIFNYCLSRARRYVE